MGKHLRLNNISFGENEVPIAVYEYKTNEFIGAYKSGKEAATVLLKNPQKAKNLLKTISMSGSRTNKTKLPDGRKVYAVRLKEKK